MEEPQTANVTLIWNSLNLLVKPSWEAGVPGSQPRPNQAKEAAKVARKVFHTLCGCSGCCDLGPEGRGHTHTHPPHPPRTELAQEKLQLRSLPPP